MRVEDDARERERDHLRKGGALKALHRIRSDPNIGAAPAARVVPVVDETDAPEQIARAELGGAPRESAPHQLVEPARRRGGVNALSRATNAAATLFDDDAVRICRREGRSLSLSLSRFEEEK